jgi:dihydroorotate dehydrogenase subfamily 1
MTEDRITFGEYQCGFGPDAALEEAWRCLQCQDPPCEQGCPAGVPVRKFIRKIRNLDFRGAALAIRRENVLGGSCARVCATASQCQRQCTRAKMDRPVDIGGLQRFVCDWEMQQGAVWGPSAKPTGKRVAVIGAGPAGLAAAAELSLLGHAVTVFEAGERAGGMLIHGIPSMRLPPSVVEYEVEAIAGLGVEFKLENRVGKMDPGFDATVVAVGLTHSVKLKIPGEDLEGVHDALDILRAKADAEKPRLGRRVLVIGGGNTAMDAATTALRLGADDVCVLYRRGDFEMPAWKKEVDRARAEGVSIRTHAAPVAFLGEGGRVRKVRCVVTVHGPEDQSGRRRPVAVEGCKFDLEADDVIVAAGETIDSYLAAGLGLARTEDGLIECDQDRATPAPGVFAAGDLTRWDRTVVQAVADGRKAARSVHEYLGCGKIPAVGGEIPAADVDLSVDFCGVRLIHPFVLAAAPPTDDLEMLRAGFEAGWAGAVLKTTAVESEPVDLKYPMMTGYPVGGRRVVGLGNIDLISEHHIDAVEKRVEVLKKEFPDRVIIGSIMGSARRDWELLVSRLEAAGADVIECSFSCPQGTLGGEGSFAGQMLGQNVELTREVTSWIKGAAKRCPVVIKITPQVADIAAVSRAVREGGADAVCASNTIPALMGIDCETFTPLPDVGGRTSFSGLSGPAILPITLRNIALVARHSCLPVAGTGGPVHYLDAVQMMLVGAAYVQFCTAVMTYGYDIVEDLVSGLGWYLKDRGLSSPSELVGRALDRVTTHDRLVPADRVRSRVDEQACVGCGRCYITCRDGGHRAIGFGADRRPTVDDDRCVGCGMCAAVCPVSGCIRMAAV